MAREPSANAKTAAGGPELTSGVIDGRRARAYLYGKSRAEVAEKLNKALRDKHQHLPVRGSRQTFGQFLTHWLEETIKPSAKPRSFESFGDVVHRHVAPDLGHIALEQLTPQHVQSLLNRKLEAGLSPQTVSGIRSVIRSALQRAMKWNLVSRNAATLVDPPHIVKYEPTALSLEQSQQLLEAARSSRFEAAIVIAVNLGLRRGEVLGLTWDNVDFTQKSCTSAKPSSG
jgi:integrase